MSAPFVTELRARPETIRIGAPGAAAINLRIEMPEVWDVVRMVAAADAPVLALKTRALEALFPEAVRHEDFVLKLRGWEILDESVSITDAGAIDGSILLLTHRRRRAVR